MNKHTILVIDDHEVMRKFLETALKKNYNVVVKKDGLEALHWLEEGNMTDLVIADINMPNMDGIEFLKNIKASTFHHSIQVIMLSARNKSDDRIKCLEAGAVDYLVKPFNPKELELKIKTHLM